MKVSSAVIAIVLSSILAVSVVVVEAQGPRGTNKSVAPTPTVTRPGTMPPAESSTLPPITPFPTEATTAETAPPVPVLVPVPSPTPPTPPTPPTAVYSMPKLDYFGSGSGKSGKGGECVF